MAIPSKLRLVLFDYGKGVTFKKPFSELFIFFFWLNPRISLTGVHPHMKLGRDIDFGDAGSRYIYVLVNTLLFGKPQYNFGPYITIGHACLCNSLT